MSILFYSASFEIIQQHIYDRPRDVSMLYNQNDCGNPRVEVLGKPAGHLYIKGTRCTKTSCKETPILLSIRRAIKREGRENL